MVIEIGLMRLAKYEAFSEDFGSRSPTTAMKTAGK